MTSRNVLFSLVLVAAFVLSACGGASTPEAMMDKPTDEMMEHPTEDPMAMHETPTPDAMMAKPTEGAMMDSPAWFSASFTDARTGAAFSINDLKGKVILVETMAMWCSNCRQQQGQVKALREALGQRDDFVAIGLDIDPNENLANLKTYVETNGFDWLYAVPSADVSREISSLYGAQFLNPPSTPIVLIDRHGVATALPFGVKSAEQLLQFIQPLLDEGM
jgi:thiol-disulfide isomerase/thioredoxin